MAHQRHGDHGALAVLQRLHLLLDRPERYQPVHEHPACPGRSGGAVGRLVLDGRVPPGIVMDHRVGRGEVQPDPPAFRLIRNTGTSPA